jgi:hypothetical protein
MRAGIELPFWTPQVQSVTGGNMRRLTLGCGPNQWVAIL